MRLDPERGKLCTCQCSGWWVVEAPNLGHHLTWLKANVSNQKNQQCLTHKLSSKTTVMATVITKRDACAFKRGWVSLARERRLSCPIAVLSHHTTHVPLLTRLQAHFRGLDSSTIPRDNISISARSRAVRTHTTMSSQNGARGQQQNNHFLVVCRARYMMLVEN